MVGKLFQQQPKPDPQFQGINNIVALDNQGNIWNTDVTQERISRNRRDSKLWHLSYIPLFVILILLFLVVLLPLLDQVDLRTQYLLNRNLEPNVDKCSYDIVESIPSELVYPKSSIKSKSTYETWKHLIKIAEHTIEIGSFYWTLKRDKQFVEESKQGDDIYNRLLDAGLTRNITIKITQNQPNWNFPNNDTHYLQLKKAAQVKSLNFDVLIGSGILHTKFWLVDRKHLYIGSANMDWRALTQVKELGVVVYNCSTLAEDLGKIFDVYWKVGNRTSLPTRWPESLSTIYNSQNPIPVDLNNSKGLVYISSSPPQFSPKGRNDDLDAIIQVMSNAEEFIYISVMNFIPLILYTKNLRFWPVIDNEIRSAVIDRNVQVRLLTSIWSNTRPMEFHFLRSLLAINKFKKNAILEVKLFRVPANESQSLIPFTRVNHNKYMVTDNAALIGTSNWCGDYFINTGGVSIVFPSENGTRNVIQEKLKSIFDRDWNSPYTESIPYKKKVIPEGLVKRANLVS